MMKTADEIIKEIVNERPLKSENDWQTERQHEQVLDYQTIVYIDKNYSFDAKSKLGRTLIFKIFEIAEAKRAKRRNAKDKMIASDELESHSNTMHPFHTLYEYVIPYAAKAMSETDILTLFEYYLPENEVILKRSSNYYSHTIYFGNHLLHSTYFLDLLTFYQHYHSITPKISKQLDMLKLVAFVKDAAQQMGLIDKLKVNEAELSHKYRSTYFAEPKIIAAKTIAQTKKWQFLQEHPCSFIPEKQVFFNIIEILSMFDYHHRFEFDEMIKLHAANIEPAAYEVFVLDLLEFVKKDGKRSGWFKTDKLRVFQFIVQIMMYLETPNRFKILGKIAEKSFTKIPRVGPTSRKMGDFVLKMIVESKSIEGLGTLLGLQAKAKYHIFLTQLRISVRRMIEYTGLNPSVVEDFFIDDFELKNNQLSTTFDDFRSEIRVESYDKVQLIWYKPDGKTQKSVPSKVKNNFPTALKIWKTKQKDIKKALSTQRQRIEGFWRKKKYWQFEDWQQYFLQHELLNIITKRLIWTFQVDNQTVSGIFKDGEMIDVNGQPLKNLHQSKVRLWHPCNHSVEEVQGWRQYFLNNEIKQPFKQAFREVYIVTDAEINTSTYSNRYLNHVLMHHKFAAIAKQRLWDYESVYAQYDPEIIYKDYNIRATFDLANDYEYASTGRVHFQHTQNRQAVKMENVPPIVFSEVMRDVDLFVGVCSIGTQAEWDNNLHRDYWYHYSQADLSELAKTRRDILKNMLPKLKISQQCELTNKYLRVKGKIRTYKIHLGSSNILMEPNDQYLCIVPNSRGNGKRIFLPFDDDKTFSIILSKAFLLAEDDKITDSTILSQLKY